MNQTPNKDALLPFVTNEELVLIGEKMDEELEELDKLENNRFTDKERASFLARLYASSAERERIIELFELGGLTRPELNDEPIASIAPREKPSQQGRRHILWSSVSIAAAVLVCFMIFQKPDDPSPRQLAYRSESVQKTTPESLLPSDVRTIGATIDASFALYEFDYLPNGSPASKSLGKKWVPSETEEQPRDEDKIMDEIAERLKTTFNSKEAKQLFEKLSPEAKKSVKGEVLRGTIAFVQGELETAEQAFRAALELAPDNFTTTYNLATTLYAQNRPADAKIYFDRLEAYEEYKNNEYLQSQIANLYRTEDNQ